MPQEQPAWNVADPGLYFQKQIVAKLSYYLGVAGLIGFIARSALPYIQLHPITWINLVLSLSILAIPLYFIRKISIDACGILLIVLCSGYAFVGGLSTGGMRAPGALIMVLTPIIGFFVSGRRGAGLAVGLGIAQVFLLLIAEKNDWLLGQPMMPEYYSYGLGFVYLLGSLITYAMGSAFFGAQNANRKLIESLYLNSVQQTKMASLGEISAGIAHEVNNPLAIITTTLPLLGDVRANAELYQAKIAIIDKAIARIAHIVKGLRRFSHSPGDQLVQSASLRQIVDEAAMIAKFRNYEVPVEIEVPDDLQIQCDPIEIEQVVVNLINNAVDAAADHEDKWVKIVALKQGEKIVLRVIDSGSGLDPRKFEKLFQPFFTTKPVGKGTGLGLSICKRLLERNAGSIRLNRELANTCFEVSFPNYARK